MAAEDDAAAKRIAEAVTGERDLDGQIDAIANALLLERGRPPHGGIKTGITAWERAFIVPIIDRWNKYGEKTRLSPKQLAVIERIHDKIKNRIVL